ncbi:hypothetical protein G6F63_014620 [Rhizopus arrhizus]|nr:hypothetical protein G6F63_014620 [Rhizopus arrhizus]
MLDIVLVEDDARLGTMVSDYLQRHGYQVAHERSGERAVTRILAEKPALVLLDVGLPDQDGFEVSWGWNWAPTTTSASRSNRGCCWPACAPTCAATAGSSRAPAACASAS